MPSQLIAYSISALVAFIPLGTPYLLVSLVVVLVPVLTPVFAAKLPVPVATSIFVSLLTDTLNSPAPAVPLSLWVNAVLPLNTSISVPAPV